MPPQQNEHDAPHEFNGLAGNYQTNKNQQTTFTDKESMFFAHYKAQKIYEWFPVYQHKLITILDFGCGDGLMTEYIHLAFPLAQTFGIDPAAKNIEAAQKHFPASHFSWFDGIQTPFASETMDLVVAAGVFRHIPPAQHQACIDEIMRILKPGGHFILFELNPFNPLVQLSFRGSPTNRNAAMLFPAYARQLVAPYGTPITKYHCFFPRFVHRLQFLERYVTWLGLGTRYTIIVKKIV